MVNYLKSVKEGGKKGKKIVRANRLLRCMIFKHAAPNDLHGRTSEGQGEVGAEEGEPGEQPKGVCQVGADIRRQDPHPREGVRRPAADRRRHAHLRLDVCSR